MAEGQLAQQADDKVQRHREDNVHRDRDEHIGYLASETAAVKQKRDNGIEQDDEREGDDVMIELNFFLHRYTFSLIFLPSRPVGLTTSTRTRPPNTMASAQSVEI